MASLLAELLAARKSSGRHERNVDIDVDIWPSKQLTILIHVGP
jgi:hypothetical protein